MSGHIPTGKLIKACWTHPGVPVQSVGVGEATSGCRPWSDKPRSIHTLPVPSDLWLQQGWAPGGRILGSTKPLRLKPSCTGFTRCSNSEPSLSPQRGCLHSPQISPDCRSSIRDKFWLRSVLVCSTSCLIPCGKSGAGAAPCCPTEAGAELVPASCLTKTVHASSIAAMGAGCWTQGVLPGVSSVCKQTLCLQPGPWMHLRGSGADSGTWRWMRGLT